MSVFTGSSAYDDFLVFSVDAGSNRSYNRTANQSTLINTNSWTAGTGSVTNYSLNGGTNESIRLYNTDPYGNQGIVWKSTPVDGNADGGWEGTSQPIDRGALYRSCVWVRRVGSTGSGTIYHGLHTNGTNDVIHRLDGNTNTNPYWDYRTGTNYTQNVWYLLVGHIYPMGDTGTTAHPNSGIWDTNGNKIASNAGNIPNDVRFPTDATTMLQRVYHYYSGDPNSSVEFAYPRIDKVDGTEPSIAELCRTLHNGMYAVGPGSVSPPYNQPTWSSSGGGSFTFNGSDQYFYYPNSTLLDTNQVTVECWVKTNALSQNGFWFEKGSVNTQYAVFQEGASIQWRTCNSNSSPYDTLSVSTASYLNTTDWFHIAATYTSGSKIVYINGVQAASNVASGTLATNTYGMNIGRHSSGYYYNGNIAAVKVYNRSLTASEVMHNFNASRSRFGR